MVQLATVHGLPLNMFKYPTSNRRGFKINVSLKPGFNLSSFIQSANQIELLISKEIAMICLKMDAATHMDRDFLGVNIQFMDKKLIKIRTLNIIELHDRHTVENLTEEVLKCWAF